MKAFFYLTLAITLLAGSCNGKGDAPDVSTNPKEAFADKQEETKLDTTNTTSIDSTIFFFNKEVGCKLIADSCRAKYYQTGKDKYRLLGNKYVDSVHYYTKLLLAYSHYKPGN